MAIQAQHLDIVTYRNLHLQVGGASGGVKTEGGGGDQFGDQPNYGAVMTNNSRKRVRETAGAMAADSPLIDLGKLNSSQQKTGGGGVSTGLGLAFNDPHQQLHRQQQQQNSVSISPQHSHSSSVLQSELATQIKQQRDEIDHFLLAQGEQLRRGLAEKRQKHYRTLINAAEEILKRKLREKEAEVGKSLRRNAELEAKANQLSVEVHAWQARARMQENYVATLELQLQQSIIANGGGKSGVNVQDVDEYGGGGEGSSAGEAEDAESAYIDPDRVVVCSGPICKSCRKRVASMVLLPCRHMCLCTQCDAVAQACPACLSLRSSSVEVCFP